jgi:hypothetical protein
MCGTRTCGLSGHSIIVVCADGHICDNARCYACGERYTGEIRAGWDKERQLCPKCSDRAATGIYNTFGCRRIAE